MYGKDTFKTPALPYCFSTKVKKENVPLVHIQEIPCLLAGAITSTMVALAMVRQTLQQASTEFGEDLTTDISLPWRDWTGHHKHTWIMH